MGRGDTQDLEDVKTLLRLEYRVSGRITAGAEVEAAAIRARVPAIYHEIFPEACRRIVSTAEEIERELRQSGDLGP